MSKGKSCHNKGRIKSQSEYDQEAELRNLYREAFAREEHGFEKTVTALVKALGFSAVIAKQRVSEWQSENKVYMPEADGAKKKRKKRQGSLEAKLLKRRMTKDEYNKYKESSL